MYSVALLPSATPDDDAPVADREDSCSVQEAHHLFVKHRAGLDLRDIYPLGRPFFIWGDNDMPSSFRDDCQYDGTPRTYLDAVNLFGQSFITSAVVYNLQQGCLWVGEIMTVMLLEDKIINDGIDINLDTARATDQINDRIGLYRFRYKVGLVVAGLRLSADVEQILSQNY